MRFLGNSFCCLHKSSSRSIHAFTSSVRQRCSHSRCSSHHIRITTWYPIALSFSYRWCPKMKTSRIIPHLKNNISASMNWDCDTPPQHRGDSLEVPPLPRDSSEGIQTFFWPCITHTNVLTHSSPGLTPSPCKLGLAYSTIHKSALRWLDTPVKGAVLLRWGRRAICTGRRPPQEVLHADHPMAVQLLNTDCPDTSGPLYIKPPVWLNVP